MAAASLRSQGVAIVLMVSGDRAEVKLSFLEFVGLESARAVGVMAEGAPFPLFVAVRAAPGRA